MIFTPVLARKLLRTSSCSVESCGLGAPVKQSMPVVSAEPRSAGRFEEGGGGGGGREEPELTALSLTELAGRAAQLEAEHYDSSPIPGSCYDTASESVEPEQTD